MAKRGRPPISDGEMSAPLELLVMSTMSRLGTATIADVWKDVMESTGIEYSRGAIGASLRRLSEKKLLAAGTQDFDGVIYRTYKIKAGGRREVNRLLELIDSAFNGKEDNGNSNGQES